MGGTFIDSELGR